MTKSRQQLKTRNKPQQKSAISPVMIGIVAVAAILVVAGLILLGNQAKSSTGGKTLDVSRYPTLGKANAPVTIIEFSDYG